MSKTPSGSSSTTADTPTSASGNKICKVVIQQCLQADLKFDTDDTPVSIGKGMVVFVCFLQGAAPDRISTIVKSITSVKLCEPDVPLCDGKGGSADVRRKSVLDCDYDILVIPQATLGGKLKGTTVQYHGLVSKDLGCELFQALVAELKDIKTVRDRNGNVECGVYGARQILRMETNGPFTHVLEF